MSARRGPGRHLLPLLLAVASGAAWTQTPAYEPPNLKTVLFAGYSAVNVRPGRDLDRQSWNGWTASFTSYHIFSRWGLTAEYRGSGKADSRQTSYLFGGTFRAVQRKRIALTGRILAGATDWAPKAPPASAHPEQIAFTFAFGQSVDFKLSERLALRVQPDLQFARFKDATGASKISVIRPLSVGIVYQFGAR